MTITPALSSERRQRGLDQGQRREQVRLVHRPQLGLPGSRREAGCGLGPSRLALFTSSRSGPASVAAATSAARCDASVTSPGRAIRRAECSSRAVASRSAARRASPTTVQPRSSRAAVTALPKPREAPVTIATGFVFGLRHTAILIVEVNFKSSSNSGRPHMDIAGFVHRQRDSESQWLRAVGDPVLREPGPDHGDPDAGGQRRSSGRCCDAWPSSGPPATSA